MPRPRALSQRISAACWLAIVIIVLVFCAWRIQSMGEDQARMDKHQDQMDRNQVQIMDGQQEILDALDAGHKVK